ncbi:MAG: STAS domain-containing protein [Bacteroidota bacterium]
MEFSCDFNAKADHCVLTFKGNLIERNQANETLDRFADMVSKDINRFIIDLNDFKYMNSTGLNVMLMVLTKSRKAGGEAVLCNVSANISSLLSVTKLNSVFSVYNSLAEAEEAISKVAN